MYEDLGRVKGYLRADGKRVVNENGEEILLRGVGLGNWMLPEGYMWKFFKGADRPRRIEQLIVDLIGENEARPFWKAFHDNFITESDIRMMAEENLNSVRLAINARHIVEDGEPLRWNKENIARIDRLIEWCRTYKLYVILDLHGAPGGQTGANIDDCESDQPELFQSDAYRERTINLWRMLAERYRDEWIVGGYDLLNEPLPDWFNQYNDQLMPLYRDITAAIREVDSKHMIILEGAHWATDWSMFTETIDDNVMLQFHKYWSSVETASIQKYLDKREELNVPIYMGEGGENSWDWYIGAFGLYEDHNIGWNFWPWKKLDNANSPCSINRPKDWDLIIRYAEGGEKPDTDKARVILHEFLVNIRFENCLYTPEVMHSVQRKLPFHIPAEYYGNLGEGIDHHSAGIKEREAVFRVADGIAIAFVHDDVTGPPSFQSHGKIHPKEEDRLYIGLSDGEWVKYTVFNEADCSYTIRVKASFPDINGKLLVYMNDVLLPRDGYSDTSANWTEYTVASGINLLAGKHEIRMEAEGGEVRVDWLDISEA